MKKLCEPTHRLNPTLQPRDGSYSPPQTGSAWPSNRDMYASPRALGPGACSECDSTDVEVDSSYDRWYCRCRACGFKWTDLVSHQDGRSRAVGGGPG